MKKNNLFLCAIIVLVATFFTSCTNENNDVSLTISLTTQPATAKVYAGTPVTIAGTSSTTGKFRMIQMVSNPIDGSAPVDLPEGAVTSIANTGGTVNFSRIITTFSKSTVVKVNVIDMNGTMSTTEFKVTILENNTTAAVTAISNYTATTGGNIADIGEAVTARGVVYGPDPLPTIELAKKTE